MTMIMTNLTRLYTDGSYELIFSDSGLVKISNRIVLYRRRIFGNFNVIMRKIKFHGVQ